MVTDGDNYANTLMTANKGALRWDRPVTKRSMKVRVAYAGAVELDETLAWCKLSLGLDRVIVLDLDASTTGRNDGGGLSLWYGRRHSGAGWSGFIW